MGWSDTWADILAGGNQRWKITSETSHAMALAHFQRFVSEPKPEASAPGYESPPPSVFCPLAGDDPFVHLLWSKGYSVTAIDRVPAAVGAMRAHFGPAEEWSKIISEEGGGTTTVWKHQSGRATLLVGDALQSRSSLKGKFDAVYDKDSFGALPTELRRDFCARVADYTKIGGILYLECKLKENHEDARDVGPPYSLTKVDLMNEDCYGTSFVYIEGLGSVYDLPMAGMKQTGHVMKRK